MEIGKYKFTLKKFEHMASRSEETNCFGAILCVNKVEFANCGNSGHGCSTDINVYSQHRELEREIVELLKSQPKYKPEGYDLEIDMDLELIVDLLVESKLKEKNQIKLKAKTKKSLLFKGADGILYTISWKKVDIAIMLSSPKGIQALKDAIKCETVKGSKLINENIPPEICKINE